MTEKELHFIEVIRSLNKRTFSSHDFIQRFLAMYEEDYIELLNSISVNDNNEKVQQVNAKISRYLYNHKGALRIEPLPQKEYSMNMHGLNTKSANWRFLDYTD